VQNRTKRAAGCRRWWRQIGVTTEKRSAQLTMVVTWWRPTTATTRCTCATTRSCSCAAAVRIQGMGSVMVLGEGDYAMRIWLGSEQAGRARPGHQ